MKLNKDKHIGRVLFIVEGSRTEFVILRRIFCNLLGYNYIEKRRNKPTFFTNNQDHRSRVAVINTSDSNISDIGDVAFLDNLFDALREQYQFPVDQSAIYYIFDRDPKSNTDVPLIENYIRSLANPYENDNGYNPGQLLLSYPSIESYIISNFYTSSYNLRFTLGAEAKTYIGQNTDIQVNKFSDETLISAAREFLTYLENEKIMFDIDEFAPASYDVFTKQEQEYLSGAGFKVFSMLTLAFLQLGILEMDEDNQ